MLSSGHKKESMNLSEARRYEKKKKKNKKLTKGLLYLLSSLNVGSFWLSMSFHFNDLKIATRKNINANSRSNFTKISPVSELFTFFW